MPYLTAISYIVTRRGIKVREPTSLLLVSLIFCLALLDGAIVIDEDECVFIVRVLVALCSFVSRAKIALRSVNSGPLSLQILVHASGSYLGRVIFDGASFCPLRPVSELELT
jgi:hypothetical protein